MSDDQEVNSPDSETTQEHSRKAHEALSDALVFIENGTRISSAFQTTSYAEAVLSRALQIGEDVTKAATVEELYRNDAAFFGDSLTEIGKVWEVYLKAKEAVQLLRKHRAAR